MKSIPSNKFRVGIVGAGLIGVKRAQSIKELKQDITVMIADVDQKRAAAFGKKYHCDWTTSWRKLINRSDIDVVIVATPHKFLMPVILNALKNKKHILCEKPFGRNGKEALKMFRAAKKYNCLIKVGFNHRFHPSLMKAKEIFDKGGIGRLLVIRAKYGHGGRLGLDKEWRASKTIAGGGELIDQGVHLIDLCRWFAGDIKEVFGKMSQKFWPVEVEDNAFVLMESEKKVSIQFHASWINWKNTFSFEIFGDKGFLIIEGLGRSYGKEKLFWGIRNPSFGIPKVKKFIFAEKDVSWVEEWKNFKGALERKNRMIGDGLDGLKANEIIDAIYKSAQTGKFVQLKNQ